MSGRADPHEEPSAAFEARIRADERGRLARELHDTIGQAFVVLSMDAARLLRQTDRDGETVRPLVEALSTRLAATIALVRTTQSAWRASSDGEMPPESFARAVVECVEEAARRGGLAFRVEISVDAGALEPASGRAGRKALVAALDNVVRHAQASRVEVAARLDPHGLSLSIEDDGIGFDPTKAEKPTSTGLLSMRERAAAHGGTLVVDRPRGRGTRVRLTFPASPRREGF